MKNDGKHRNVDQPRDPDLAGAEIAIRRAAQMARERAARHGLGVVVWKAGRIVIEKPNWSADSKV